jgi:isochorismate synthase EntC
VTEFPHSNVLSVQTERAKLNVQVRVVKLKAVDLATADQAKVDAVAKVDDQAKVVPAVEDKVAQGGVDKVALADVRCLQSSERLMRTAME